MAKAMLHSRDKDGTHRAKLADVEILREAGSNDFIVRTPEGILCHALFNPFTGYYFADDISGIVTDSKEEQSGES